MAADMSNPQLALAAVIQCNQCHNQLQQPHTLEQCLHSFCKTCLDGIPKKPKEGETGWFCPACLTFSKEDDLRQNSFIEDLITVSKGVEENDVTQMQKCKQCPKKDKEATGKCRDCKIELCDDCRISHLQIPILSNHTIENIGEKAEKLIDKLMLCTLHQTSPIEFNCTNCEKAICQTCILSEHNSHTIQTVNQAIEHLQPQLESKLGAIRSNIEAMEAQIKTITRRIEQTKESYASCRIEMDESLEVLINRLKAVKAQMEDEITEQETIALDILKNMKLNLENQLSFAKNLNNLSEVTADKSRHTSFLYEMQTGLYSKVQETGSTKQQSVDLKIKVPEFEDPQNLTVLADELQHLFGELSYNEYQCNVDVQGVVWTANEFMCESLKDIFDKEHRKVIEIDLDVKWCNRLSYFDNKLWICCPDDGVIKVYNKEGELANIIETKNKIVVIDKVNNGDIIAAGKTGIYITNNECSEWKKLSAGVFSDLCVHDHRFSVLDFANEKVITFTLNNDHESGNKVWSEESSFTVDTLHIFDSNSTLLVDADSNYLVCTSSNILKYTNNGVSLEEDISLGYRGFLCGVDSLGNLLSTNFGAGQIYVYDLLKDLSGHNQERLCYNQESKGEQLRDVTIDSNSNIWYLEGNKDIFRLVKYKHN